MIGFVKVYFFFDNWVIPRNLFGQLNWNNGIMMIWMIILLAHEEILIPFKDDELGPHSCQLFELYICIFLHFYCVNQSKHLASIEKRVTFLMDFVRMIGSSSWNGRSRYSARSLRRMWNLVLKTRIAIVTQSSIECFAANWGISNSVLLRKRNSSWFV